MTEIKTDNRTFLEYLKGLIRAWFILGILIAVFVLLNGILNGQISISTDKNELEGIQAIIFICVGIPLGMALNGLIWGLISYFPYLLVNKITSCLFFKSS